MPGDGSRGTARCLLTGSGGVAEEAELEDGEAERCAADDSRVVGEDEGDEEEDAGGNRAAVADALGGEADAGERPGK